MMTHNIARKLAASLATMCSGTVADSSESFQTIEGSVTHGGKICKVRLKVETVSEDDGVVQMIVTSAPPDVTHREALNILPYLSKVALNSDDGQKRVDGKADIVFKRVVYGFGGGASALEDYAGFESMRGEGAEQFAAESEATRNALVGVTVAPETNVGLVMVDDTPVEVKVLGSHVKLLGLRVTAEKANAVIAALTA